MPRLGLYQPDIPQNTGTMLRLAACLGVAVDIVEPAGFDVSDRNLRRAGLDYLERATIARHASFRAFEAWRAGSGGRLVLATTKGATAYTDFAFRPDDIVLMGREIGRRAGGGPCRGGCTGRRADAAGAAFPQRRGRRGDDPRRGPEADGDLSKRRALSHERSLRDRGFRMIDAAAVARLKDETAAWFASLQDRFCAAFETLEREASGPLDPQASAPGRFERRPWQRTDPSGSPAAAASWR